MVKEEEPLVSIIVITYNSSKYVLETLESAKAQTYQNIELIVSDDCSSDNTVELCRQWILENRKRFVKAVVIEVEKNSGIAANCNRGLYASHGEWIKFIAGDDTLMATCLSDFVSFVGSSTDQVVAVYGQMNVYKNTLDSSSFIQLKDYSSDLYNSPNITAKQQYQLNLRRVWIGAPSTFLQRDLLLKVGGWDEEMPYEDWPMFLTINAAGYKIHYLNNPVVNYRIHGDSMFNKTTKTKLIFNDFFKKDRKVYNKYRKDYLTQFERFIEGFEYFRKIVFTIVGLNRDNLINRYVNLFFLKTANHLRRRCLANIRRNIL
jgi:glycosyltransferase involved in cell wall biosynthesis